ncbi:hypothetical protein CIPAW_07G152000 [Carya illinoinensis]|uniref:Uncharacterized protein n=1 Tax=Carya illinoinensis TaxID=32201 RepID=A0A8T1PZE1_CARIL|nr:hypothetical protein CIPAW_07G152000 [Carya illinoinensis]
MPRKISPVNLVFIKIIGYYYIHKQLDTDYTNYECLWSKSFGNRYEWPTVLLLVSWNWEKKGRIIWASFIFENIFRYIHHTRSHLSAINQEETAREWSPLQLI